MKSIHVPRVDARYWLAILLASVFGMNLGDLYAHESGLGIGKGLLVLAVLAGVAFVAERFDDRRHELWYWLVILIIRTGGDQHRGLAGVPGADSAGGADAEADRVAVSVLLGDNAWLTRGRGVARQGRFAEDRCGVLVGDADGGCVWDGGGGHLLGPRLHSGSDIGEAKRKAGQLRRTKSGQSSGVTCKTRSHQRRWERRT